MGFNSAFKGLSKYKTYFIYTFVVYMLNWCKKVPEDDLKKIEARSSLDEFYVKMYTIVTYREFVGFSELFIIARE